MLTRGPQDLKTTRPLGERCADCLAPADTPCPDGYFHGDSYFRMVDEREAWLAGKCFWSKRWQRRRGA